MGRKYTEKIVEVLKGGLWKEVRVFPVLDKTIHTTDPPQATAEPVSQVSGASAKIHSRKVRKHCTDRGGGKKKKKQKINSSVSTKVREGGRAAAPGAEAENALQPHGRPHAGESLS